MSVRLILLCITTLTILIAPSSFAQRQMEHLTRGLVALPNDEGDIFVSWRLLVTDPDDVAFNVYRVSKDGTLEQVNDEPIVDSTNYIDDDAPSQIDHRYLVKSISEGQEISNSQPVTVWDQGYLEIPIRPIDTYLPGDASIADLDGDGEYELVLHQVSRGRDNSHSGITGRPILDAYEFDGTHLWRIDLGINIREGEHYTQFLVYDLDGDGSAELACKTADGTRDGQGTVIGDAEADWRTTDESARSFGRVLKGPEYLTVFSGRTGEALQTVEYIPSRDPIDGWGGVGGNGNNDAYGNRCDRFLACVAYLDGRHPSLVMCRGVYGRTVLAAWDWRDSQLQQRWVFDSGISYPPFDDASTYSGMGGHSISVADVDGDQHDEIVYQAMVIDDDGSGLYSTKLRHGDAMHVGDLDPQHPGLEVFTIQENEGNTTRFRTPGAVLRDARTGDFLWSHSPAVDVGAGMAADIDPRYPGCEAWGGPGGLRSAKGEVIGPAPRTIDFAIWWDGDLLRELLTRTRVTKWNWESKREDVVFEFRGRGGTRGPNLMGDLIGDWREEILTASPDGKSLRLYTTTLPTSHRLVCLMQDPMYRLGIVRQNVGYNKPTLPSFFLGHDMSMPARPEISIIDLPSTSRDD